VKTDSYQKLIDCKEQSFKSFKRNWCKN